MRSGLYFFGSGERFGTTFGDDLRRQALNASNRLRPNGTIVPRNNFTGEAIHRVDVRIQRGRPLSLELVAYLPSERILIEPYLVL